MSTVAPPTTPLNPVLVDSEGYIDGQIRRTRRALKLVDLAAGVISLLIGLSAFVLTAAVLDHWVVPGGLNVPGRAALFALFLAGAAWYAWRQFIPLLRPINPVYAAHTIERGAPSLKNSLLNLLLFRTHRQQMSARVYHALEQQAALRLSSAPGDTSIDHSSLLRLGYVLLAVVAVSAVYAVLSPKNMMQSAGRVLAPWADLAAPSRVQILDVKPGDLAVAKGERVPVSAEILGLRDDDSVRVRFSTADEQQVDQLVSMNPAEVGVRYEARLPRSGDGSASAGVEQDLHYWIEAGDARSRMYKITVFDRPTIVVQNIRYEYPAYTGFPTKTDDSTGDIRGLEGTKVTISALANQPIRSAYVDFNADGGSDPRMAVEGMRASLTFDLRLRDDRRTAEFISYALRFTTAEGRKNVDPPVFRIEVTPDYAPEVRITQPEAPEHTAQVDEMVLVDVEARDPDFQLAQVRLEGAVGERAVSVADLLTKNHNGLLRAKRPFVPADLQLKAGDVLEYWAVAEDNRRPDPNVTKSERRRLRIVGADEPRGNQGQQQPGGQQRGGDQQNDGQGDDGGQGNEGEAGPQGGANGQEGDDGGQGGEQGNQDQAESQGADGSGAGGERPPQDNGQQQPSSGGAGDGSNTAQDTDPQPGQGNNQGENPGENSSAPAEGQPQGNEQGPPQGGSPNDGQPGEGQPQQGSPQSAQPAGEQRPGAGDASESQVSAEGDEDAKAFERIAEHLDKQNDGAQDPGQGGEQNPQDAAQNAEQAAGEGQNRTQGKPGEAGEGAANAQQEGAAGENPEQGSAANDQPHEGASQPDKPSGAAGQSQRQSNQAPPAAGSGSDDPAEQAGDAEQQAAPGENPSKRQGEDTPREAQNGDGNPENPQGAGEASPDSAMNRNNSDAGSGGATGKEQGASQSEQLSHKQAADKTDEDNQKRMDDEEPPMASPDKKESNSRGGQGGEQTGGGQEGGGQPADAQGKGNPGQHEATDEGSGRADEQGRGETGQGAGQDQVAEGQTGESSGDQAGAGSQQREGGSQPGEAEGSDAAPGQPADAASGQQSAGDEPPQGEGGSEASEQNRANAQPREGEPPQGKPSEGSQSSSAESGSAAAGSQPQGGNASAGSNAQAPPPPGGEAQPGDAANLEFARKQTDLVLERLDEQLAKKQVDQEMLKNLGWTEEDLRRFVDRWKELKNRAAAEPNQSPAKRELDAALRALGPIKQGSTRFELKERADKLRVSEGFRASAPLEYADRVQRYAKEVAETSED